MRTYPIAGALLSATLLIPLVTGARADEPSPAPDPTPDAAPDPTPTPDAAPDAAPDPTPTPDAAPDAAPDPTPTPDAAPDAAPLPDAAPPVDHLYLRSLSYGGTGCPAGTAEVEVDDTATMLKMRFTNFAASIGAGIPLSESRKNCQMNILMHVPAGYTYALRSVDVRGYADIAAGAKGMVKTSAYFQGQMPTTSVWTTFAGPYADLWHVRDEIPTPAMVWAPCGIDRALNINAEVRINKGTSAPDATSFMSAGEEGFDQQYSIVLRHCP